MKRSEQFLVATEAFDNGDAERALRLMEQCAEEDDPVACFTVALWYRNGDGTAVDIKRSEQWMARLEQLADQGNIEGQWELGQHYRFGNLFPKDIARANYWLERSADSGYPEAQHHLAWYLETGQYGYPVDREAAEIWYQRAFQQEHPETLYTFALRQFRDGQPSSEAMMLLKKAAEKGLSQAAEILRSFTH
jgi:TPR repeat protein